MSRRIDTFIIREPDGVRTANSLVLGQGFRVIDTAGRLPELAGFAGEALLMPSGGDDTQAIRDALSRFGGVRLGPGDFNVTQQIDLTTGQAVAGCGPDRTRILTSSAAASLPAVFHLVGNGTAVEGLNVFGRGGSCISADSATDVRIRDLRLSTGSAGIELNNVVRGEVSCILAEDVGIGVSVTGGARLLVSDVTVQWSGSGLVLSQVEGARCTGLGVVGCSTAVNAGPGSAISFSSVLLEECTYGLSITNARSVVVSDLFSRDVQETAVKITGSSAVALAGCSVLHSKTSLEIGSSKAVTVDGFVSDVRLVLATAPHVVVGSGSTQVRIAGIHRINPANWPPPQYEVDVSGAGGRVLFIQHDFDLARINSGGNFAAL